MDFHKMPSSAIQHLYLGRLFAPDGRRANFLERYGFDNHPFGVDKIGLFTIIFKYANSSITSLQVI